MLEARMIFEGGRGRERERREIAESGGWTHGWLSR